MFNKTKDLRKPSQSGGGFFVPASKPPREEIPWYMREGEELMRVLRAI